jgi:HEAT repeat protein
MKAVCISLFCYILSGCSDRPLPTVHEQLRQHILEAELGSAITISFAKKPAIPLPPLQDEAILTRQLKSANKETRWAAAEKLSYSANKEVVLALIDAMRDTSGTQRVCVMAQALGHLKDPRALGALTQAAFDPYNRDLRLCAIRSIGMIGDKSAVPDLITALKQNITPLQTANTLARLGDVRAIQPLIDAASNEAIRPWMIRAIGELGKKEAVAYLTNELNKADIKQQKLIEEALWKISILSHQNNVLSLTQVLLKNQNTNKRMWAAYRLGEIKNKLAIESLIHALQDKNTEVAGRAAASIVRMSNISLKPVRHALNQVDNKNRAQLDYLYAVLGYIGDKADIEKLESLLHNNQAPVDIIIESLQLIKNGA